MTTTTKFAAAAVLVAALLVAGLLLLPTEDDKLVDHTRPDARAAVDAARAVVPGELVDVRVDSDNGKWEVTLKAGGRDYEVELEPGSLALLRIDYESD